MVAINPFNYEQIAIIFIFLSILLGVLLFVRKNKDKFSLKLRNKSSILVLEDTAINQSERLRLIKVGDETFLMSSAKGVSTQLIKLDPDNKVSKQAVLLEIEESNSKRFTKSDTSETKAKKNKTINLTDKSQSNNQSETKSIFDAIKQARDKNPLLGLNK